MGPTCLHTQASVGAAGSQSVAADLVVQKTGKCANFNLHFFNCVVPFPLNSVPELCLILSLNKYITLPLPITF